MTRLIAEGPKAGRQPCCIVGCGRTFKDEGHSEIICGKHWRLADKRVRQLRTRVLRKAARQGWSPQLARLADTLWDKAKRQAQERAMGL